MWHAWNSASLLYRGCVVCRTVKRRDRGTGLKILGCFPRFVAWSLYPSCENLLKHSLTYPSKPHAYDCDRIYLNTLLLPHSLWSSAPDIYDCGSSNGHLPAWMYIDDKLVVLQRRGHWRGNGRACQEAPGHSSMPVAVSSSAEGIRLERHSSFLQKTREQAADACWKGSCQPPQQGIPSQENFIGWSKQDEWEKSPEGVWSHTQQMLMLRQIPDSGSDLCHWWRGHQQYIKSRVVALDVKIPKVSFFFHFHVVFYFFVSTLFYSFIVDHLCP